MNAKTVALLCCIAVAVVDGSKNGKDKERSRQEQEISGLPPPPFARGANPEALRELQEIYGDLDQSKKELHDRLEQWANKQGEEIAAAFRSTVTAGERHQKRLEKRLADSKLDEKLKRIISHIIQLNNDESQTVRQEMEAIKKIQEGLSPEEYETIDDFFMDRD